MDLTTQVLCVCLHLDAAGEKPASSHVWDKLASEPLPSSARCLILSPWHSACSSANPPPCQVMLFIPDSKLSLILIKLPADVLYGAASTSMRLNDEEGSGAPIPQHWREIHDIFSARKYWAALYFSVGRQSLSRWAALPSIICLHKLHSWLVLGREECLECAPDMISLHNEVFRRRTKCCGMTCLCLRCGESRDLLHP